MLEYVHWFMLVLFVGWSGFFVYVLCRFRKSRNAKADYVGMTGHTSNYIEGIVVVIEAVLLLGFAFPLWAKRVDQFPSKKESVLVHVIAEQFAWNMHYPGVDEKPGKQDIKFISSENSIGLDRNDPQAKDDIVVVNELYLPVNKPVIIELTSKDVIHSFSLRHMRITQDNIPGMSIPIWFKPTKTSEQIREESARMYPTRKGVITKGRVAMTDYKDAAGQIIVKKLDPLTDELMKKLAAAGVSEVKGGVDVPMEIQCAQLCGMGHYRMRGYLNVVTQAEFDKWIKEKSVAAAAGGSTYD
jgi:cytochrome c oxidase subunit 2